MKSRTLISAVLVAVLAIGGYWYFSPYLALKSMRSAAERHDADAFNERVDYPRLRESLKGQLAAHMSQQASKSADSGAGALGAMLGMALINPLIDAIVRPELVMQAMQEGQLKGLPGAQPGAAGDQPATSAQEVKWEVERKGANKLIAHGRDAGEPRADKGLELVFERSGFADWKLTEIRLPAMAAAAP